MEPDDAEVELLRLRLETARLETEKAQAEVEKARAEATRAQVEVERTLAEVELTRAEVELAQAETDRARSESGRARAEQKRADQEASRAQTDAEGSRVATEALASLTRFLPTDGTDPMRHLRSLRDLGAGLTGDVRAGDADPIRSLREWARRLGETDWTDRLGGDEGGKDSGKDAGKDRGADRTSRIGDEDWAGLFGEAGGPDVVDAGTGTAADIDTGSAAGPVGAGSGLDVSALIEEALQARERRRKGVGPKPAGGAADDSVPADDAAAGATDVDGPDSDCPDSDGRDSDGPGPEGDDGSTT